MWWAFIGIIVKGNGKYSEYHNNALHASPYGSFDNIASVIYNVFFLSDLFFAVTESERRIYTRATTEVCTAASAAARPGGVAGRLQSKTVGNRKSMPHK